MLTPKLRPKRLDGTGPKAIILPSLLFDSMPQDRMGNKGRSTHRHKTPNEAVLAMTGHCHQGRTFPSGNVYDSLVVSGSCRTSSTGQGL